MELSPATLAGSVGPLADVHTHDFVCQRRVVAGKVTSAALLVGELAGLPNVFDRLPNSP